MSSLIMVGSLFCNGGAGAVPPFGHLYNMRTFVDCKLGDNDVICMNAGNHKELLQLAWKDYVLLEQPVLGSIAQPRPVAGRLSADSRLSADT
jgi:hypothetical protein